MTLLSYRQIQARATNAVYKATHNGDLPKIKQKTKCVDCGDPAKVYDHRDYFKPLNVSPVCLRCNRLRGPTINKIRDDLAEDEKRGNVRIADPLYSKLNAAAKRERRSMNALAILLIEDALQRKAI